MAMSKKERENGGLGHNLALVAQGLVKSVNDCDLVDARESLIETSQKSPYQFLRDEATRDIARIDIELLGRYTGD